MKLAEISESLHKHLHDADTYVCIAVAASSEQAASAQSCPVWLSHIRHMCDLCCIGMFMLQCGTCLGGNSPMSSSLAAQSLRQVLLELRCIADRRPPRSPYKIITHPSPRGHMVIKDTPISPALKSDSEIRRSSPQARVAPFWGPGLAPTDPTADPSSSSNQPSAASSLLSKVRQLCSRQRDLRTTALDEDADSSKLWSFDTSISEDTLRSMFYKRLCWRLGACSAKESLIAEVLQASSTGVPPIRICSLRYKPLQ